MTEASASFASLNVPRTATVRWSCPRLRHKSVAQSACPTPVDSIRRASAIAVQSTAPCGQGPHAREGRDSARRKHGNGRRGLVAHGARDELAVLAVGHEVRALALAGDEQPHALELGLLYEHRAAPRGDRDRR